MIASSPLRLRGIFCGIVLGLVLCALGPFNSAWIGSTPLGGGHFPLAPFVLTFILFLGVGLISTLRKATPYLSGSELLTIWLFSVIGTSIGYSGLVETLFLNITAPAWHAHGGFDWAASIAPYLPSGWLMADSQAIDSLYNGLAGGRNMSLMKILTAIPWGAWLPILSVWTIFILVAYATMLCIISLFGKQWIENERMHVPLLQVPKMMGESLDKGRFISFISNPYFLWGLAVPVLLHTVNGLHQHLPGIPEIPTLVLAGKFFPKFGLFSGFHKLKLYLVPAFIGFAYLTTRQISFSFWFCYLFGALFMGILYVIGLQVPEAAMGITFGPNLARPAEAQIIGGTLVFFLFLVWLARHHLLDAIRSSVTKEGWKQPPQHGEFFPQPVAVWGTLAGLISISCWCIAYGMSPLASALLPFVFFMLLLVASRVIAQGGLPQHMYTAAPIDGVLGIFGTSFMGNIGLVIGAILQKMLFLDIRESAMPTMVHGAKITEQITDEPSKDSAPRISGRTLFVIGLGIMLVASLAVAFTSMLVLAHKTGLRDLSLDWAANSTAAMYVNVAKLIEAPAGPNKYITLFAAIGAGVMLLMVVCYTRFYWWPLHPIGLLAAYSKTMRVLWFCFFAGWLANHLALHYGGTALFKRLRLFFVGLIIGDMLMGGIWAITGLYTGTIYDVLPR